MKNMLLTFFLALFIHTAAYAELSASHTAAVEKLLTALDVEKTMQNTMKGALEAGLGAGEEQLAGLPDAQKAKFKAAQAKMLEALTAEMSYDKLKADLVAVYGKAFNEQEAKDVTAMLETPAGKTYVAKQGDIAMGMAQVTQKRMKEFMPKMMQIMQEEMQK